MSYGGGVGVILLISGCKQKTNPILFHPAVLVQLEVRGLWPFLSQNEDLQHHTTSHTVFGLWCSARGMDPTPGLLAAQKIT